MALAGSRGVGRADAGGRSESCCMSTWYLKRPNGAVYGPVAQKDLCDWAADGRIGPDDRLSQDRETWIRAPELADLEMVCSVELRDGRMYGPIHIHAVIQLLAREAVLPGATLELPGAESGTVTLIRELWHALGGREQALRETRRIIEESEKARESLRREHMLGLARIDYYHRQTEQLSQRVQQLADAERELKQKSMLLAAQQDFLRRRARHKPAAAGAKEAKEAVTEG